jgi:GAF domain-containing protein
MSHDDGGHHSFAPFQLTGDRSIDDATLLSTLRITVEPSNGSYLIRYSSLSNAAALLGWYLKNVNWVGFYLRDDRVLILGPFAGLPACTRIQYGKGVCGTAFQQKKIIGVDNVHEFPGHIACDCASNSEIVTPIFVGGKSSAFWTSTLQTSAALMKMTKYFAARLRLLSQQLAKD